MPRLTLKKCGRWKAYCVLHVTRCPPESEFNQFFMESSGKKFLMSKTHSSVIASTSKEATTSTKLQVPAAYRSGLSLTVGR